MISLGQLQKKFKNAMLHNNNEIANELVTRDFFATEEGLNVYTNGYRLRLHEILEYDYLTLRAVMGDERFYTLLDEYITAYPSKSFAIGIFGKNLAHFLQEDNIRQQRKLLEEIARFEWTLEETVNTADAPILRREDLANIPPDAWPDLKFFMHPSLRLQTFYWNVEDFWQAVNAKQDLPSAVCFEEPQAYYFWRKQADSFFKALTAEQYYILRAFIDGKTFLDVCEGLCEWMPEGEVAECLATNIQCWVEEGIFRGTR